MNKKKKKSTGVPSTASAPEPKVYYPCDPEKNTQCSKTNCYTNGGPCKYTTKIDMAMQPVTTVKLVLPVDEAIAADLGIKKEEQ